MKDRNGVSVKVGDRVKVLALPNVDFDEKQLKDVSTMLNSEFAIEAIEYNCAVVSKEFSNGQNNWCHTLNLWSNEFELVAK